MYLLENGLNLTQIFFFNHNLCKHTEIYLKIFLSHLTIYFHHKETPIKIITDPRLNSHKKQLFCDRIVLLFKVWGHMKDSAVASEYGIPRSLCLCRNIILMLPLE